MKREGWKRIEHAFHLRPKLLPQPTIERDREPFLRPVHPAWMQLIAHRLPQYAFRPIHRMQSAGRGTKTRDVIAIGYISDELGGDFGMTCGNNSWAR